MADEEMITPTPEAADAPAEDAPKYNPRGANSRGKPKSKPDFWLTPDGLLCIEGWARDGLINSDIAKDKMNVAPATLSKWARRYPEIDKALQKGRRPAIVEIEANAIKAANGYWVEEQDTQVYRNKQGELKEMLVKRKRWIKPDPQMMQYLLNNRRPDKYSAKPDKVYEALMAAAQAAYTGIPAHQIAQTFMPLVFDIQNGKHSEYVLPGGRGSTKSSFISMEVIDVLIRNPQTHAVVLRQVGNTMADTVYNQIQWAIRTLGQDGEWKYTRNPLEITRLATGQKIFFRGADNPDKIKSLKPPFGHIGVVWFEELDQFKGEEAVRKIEQSVVRGGDKIIKFKSFNPPKSALNWANQYIQIPRADRLVVTSDYTTVPEEWLGRQFLDDAEFLRETNPTAYENEYLGVANGQGGNVFDNVEIREIDDSEIKHFDNVFNGVDWGWYPDPFAFARVHYDAARHTLYIWQEYVCNKRSNEQTAQDLRDRGITDNDIITCDSAEQKSVGDYRAYGLLARPAEKGPNSREYSYKWLQSLRAIVIDPIRCPVATDEFLHYEYERDKDGNVISGYPDGNDHCLTGDTKVLTEDGPKPIADLVGTTGKVWSISTETGEPELRPYADCRMTRKAAEIVRISTADGGSIKCTADHLILTERGYVEAGQLTTDDRIIAIGE